LVFSNEIYQILDCLREVGPALLFHFHQFHGFVYLVDDLQKVIWQTFVVLECFLLEERQEFEYELEVNVAV
jgi:hypothetical protein